MAQRTGHTVMYTPPHHSNLQPIETVWANVKGYVGRRYVKGKTTFKDVLTRLESAFLSLTSSSIYDCIRKANNELFKLHEYIRSQDALDDSLTVADEDESEVSFSGSSDN
ncbi:unnamed protein product [Aphanomyces euteiches]|uniref:Tc1-like transposase DDE domain-containing protein n=1 Tax=Aphanomyces euteiches TaxID=100861 RepID=A0A6G0WS91_9STRA|nr:hypothetical protein Ae201684_012321 [Aphanomyces euteiches]KAH9096495.1 hypothetical protein Ae201684P_013163 [Aphanomyces euteiches]KAH9131986.1 hypothetical protein AeRB84_021482 [Aphanomyces euteiches]